MPAADMYRGQRRDAPTWNGMGMRRGAQIGFVCGWLMQKIGWPAIAYPKGRLKCAKL